MSQHKKRLFGLRSGLERVVSRAQHSKNKGELRTIELQNELKQIGQKIKDTLDKITKEAENSDDTAAAIRAQAKEAATLEILQVEMVRLAALYHRQSDVELIQRFVREQHDIIGTSMTATAKKPSLVSLDTQIGQLHETMAEERSRVRRNARKDWIKFWVSVTIGLVSLGISLYALLFH